jgi:hypothetical protein
MADWIPTRKQNLTDLAAILVTTLHDAAKQTAYGRDTAECPEAERKITAFMNARTANENRVVGERCCLPNNSLENPEGNNNSDNDFLHTLPFGKMNALSLYP